MWICDECSIQKLIIKALDAYFNDAIFYKSQSLLRKEFGIGELLIIYSLRYFGQEILLSVANKLLATLKISVLQVIGQSDKLIPCKVYLEAGLTNSNLLSVTSSYKNDYTRLYSFMTYRFIDENWYLNNIYCWLNAIHKRDWSNICSVFLSSVYYYRFLLCFTNKNNNGACNDKRSWGDIDACIRVPHKFI